MPFPSDEQATDMVDEIENEEVEGGSQEEPSEDDIKPPEEPEPVVVPRSRKARSEAAEKRVEELLAKVSDLEGKLASRDSGNAGELRETVARLEGQIEAMQKTSKDYGPKGDPEFSRKLKDFESRARTAVANESWDDFFEAMAEHQQYVTDYKLQQHQANQSPEDAANRQAIMQVEMRHPDVVQDHRGKALVLAEFNEMVNNGAPDSIKTLEKAYKEAEKILFPKSKPVSRAQRESVVGLSGGRGRGAAPSSGDVIVKLPPAVKRVAQDLVDRGFYKSVAEYAKDYAKDYPDSVE